MHADRMMQVRDYTSSIKMGYGRGMTNNSSLLGRMRLIDQDMMNEYEQCSIDKNEP